MIDKRLPLRLRKKLRESRETGCWTGQTTAYRLIYLILVGPVKSKEDLVLRCGTVDCCNPYHTAGGQNAR